MDQRIVDPQPGIAHHLERMSQLYADLATAKADLAVVKRRVDVLQSELAWHDGFVRGDAARRLQEGQEQAEGVSARWREVWEFDENEVLEIALAEGIEQVIKRPEAKLDGTKFKALLESGTVDPAQFESVKKTQVPSVTIRKATIARAARRPWAPPQGQEEGPA